MPLHPKSRASLCNLGRVLAGHQRRSSCSKPVPTYKSRQAHYLHSCKAAKIHDPCLAHAPTHTHTRNFVLKCFVVFLLQGHTTNAHFIKAAIILGYVTAATINSMHEDRDFPTPTPPTACCGADDLVSCPSSTPSAPTNRYPTVGKLSTTTCS